MTDRGIQLILLDEKLKKNSSKLILTQAEKDAEWTAQMNTLHTWNQYAFYTHLFNGMLALVLSQRASSLSDVNVNLRTSFVEWDEVNEVAYQDLSTKAEMPLVVAASMISFGAATLHGLNLLDWGEYERQLKSQANHRRWREYSVSSAIIVSLLALVCGIQDIFGLIFIFSVQAGVCWFGDMFESLNVSTEPAALNWAPFIYASVGFLYNWYVLIWYINGSTDAWASMPQMAFWMIAVWTLLSSVIVWTTYSQYMQKSIFENLSSDAIRYAKGEEMLNKIVLVGRSAFLWVVVVGSIN